MKLLEGKVALVTGAGGGIGRDFALALGAAGAAVVVNDIGTSVHGEGKTPGRRRRSPPRSARQAARRSPTPTAWPSGRRPIE